MRSGFRWAALACLLMAGCVGQSQETAPPVSGGLSRLNTWTLFAEYSPTSSHVLLGQSRNRILVMAGGSYARRLHATKNTAFSYVAEIRPVVFVADPVVLQTNTSQILTGPYAGTLSTFSASYAVGRCDRGAYSGIVGYPGNPGEEYAYSTVNRCGWRWTFGQAFVPLGAKYSFRTQHRLQPYATVFAGYLYTSRPVPLEDAESFNFLFGAGAGLELFRTKTRSIALEARYQHFSNKNTAPENPGTDNVMYRLSYSFGK